MTKEKRGGRTAGTPNKATAHIRALAGEHADTAITTLVQLMESEDTPAAARISASKELIERGFGKSSNIVSLQLETPLSGLEPKDALATISDEVMAGRLPVDDGTKLTSMIEARMRAVDLAELDERLKHLEAKSQ